ncbi:MAG: PAS domain S-box protein, partial [Alphaproteobacteria bacterium]
MTQVLGVRAARWIPSLVVCGLAGVAVHIFGMTLAPAALAQDRGTNAPALREVVATVPRSWPPQYSVDENGKPVGFAIDVMEEIAALASLRVIYHIKDSFLEATKAVRDGRADIIPNMGIIPEREVTFAFTAPVETFRISIFVRGDTLDIKGMPDLTGRRVAVVKGNVGYLRLKHRKDMDLAVFEDVRTALFELVAGQVDALVYPQPVIMGLAEQIGVEDRIRVAGEPLFEVKRGISVHKDNTELLAVLDKAVERFVGTPAYERIYVKWFGRPMPFWTVSRVMWTMGGLVIGVMVAAVGWRYQSVVKLNRKLYATITERKRAEEALRESDMILRSTIDNYPSRIVLKDKDLRYKLTNKEFARSCGMTPEETVGKVVHDFFPKEIADDAADHDRAVLDTLDVVVQEREIPHGDGFHPHIVVKFPVLNTEGSLIGIGSILTDITERKQAEEALRESEARFRDMAESASDWFWEMDADLRFSYHSERLLKDTEIRPEELLGKTWRDLGRGDVDAEKWRRHRADLEARRPFRDFRYRFVHRDGRTLHFLVNGKPVFDQAGTFQGYRGVGSDITAQVNAEEHARSAQERLAIAIDGLSEHFVLFDSEDRIVLTNAAWRELNRKISAMTLPGVCFENCLRAAIEAGLVPESVGREEEWLRRRMDLHRNPKGPFEVKRQDGRWVLINEQRLPDGGTVLIISDITERKRAEEALRASEERFRAVVDHAPTYITLKDLDGKILLANNLYEDKIGVSRKD